MALLALYLVVAALDVAFVVSLTPSRYRPYAALATGAAALAALHANLPVVPWVPYAVAATYLGAVVNRRVEGSEVVRRPRVPRL